LQEKKNLRHNHHDHQHNTSSPTADEMKQSTDQVCIMQIIWKVRIAPEIETAGGIEVVDLDALVFGK
jgi:hypothetical protein